MAERERARRWLLVAGLCLAVVGCGGSGDAGDAGDEGGGAGQSTGAGSGDGDGSGDGGPANPEGPITIAFDGRSVGYSIGRCEVIDGVVHARARGGEQTGFQTIELTLPDWDREIAHSRRYGRIAAVVASGDGAGSEHVASSNDAGTTWDWRVSGSQVVVDAVMGDRSTATRNEGIETFTETPSVTITMDCQGNVGTGFPEGEPMHEEFFPLDPPVDRVPGKVTIELNGSSYEISYLTTCQFFSNDVSAEGVSDGAYTYFYSEGAGVSVDLSIGDLRAQESLERWTLPPDVSLQSDFPFVGSGTTRTWTGTLVSESGAEAEATLTVECTEGDAFDAAGQASVVVDGVTHALDEVTACTINGTTIDFFGRQSTGDVAVVVTSGGSDILFSDGSGQTITSGVAFDINGQQASWTGTLANGKPVTIAIDCG
jgi:hypothetical protein